MKIKLIFHCLEIAKVNAWLLYCMHCTQKNVQKSKVKWLKKFTSESACGFANAEKDPSRTVGQPKRSISPKPPTCRKPSVPAPTDVHFGKIAHWPDNNGACNKCKLCSTHATVVLQPVHYCTITQTRMLQP